MLLWVSARPRSQDALNAVFRAIVLSKVSHVLDVDIKGYFNNIVHEHLMIFTQRRIRHRSHLRLLGKWLHVGSAGRRTTAACHEGHGSRRGDQSRAV